MRSRRLPVLLTSAAACLLVGASAPYAAAHGPHHRPPLGPGHHGARDTLGLSVLGTHATGQFDQSAAEITDYDPMTRRVFVVNAQRGQVDVLDVRDPSHPREVRSVSVAGLRATDGSTTSAGAVVNSVAVSHGLVALAVEADPKTDRGWVTFLSSATLRPLRTVRVGAQPDMVTFDGSGRRVVTADEGEPADDFSVDPAGTVSVVDVPRALRGLGGAVRTADFDAYDRGRPLPEGVRVFGPDVPAPDGDAGRVSRNLEPEYVAVDGSTAYVTLQENNAIARVDLRSARVEDVTAMPAKRWDTGADALDASDKDGAIAIRQWPVDALLEPDAVQSYRSRGRTYLVTANEGDAREWGDYSEVARVGDLALCPGAFPDAKALQKKDALGRLEVSTAEGRTSAGCYDRLAAFGGRSFSILDDRGRAVFDSAGLIEQTVARLVAEGTLPRAAFNANNDDNDSFDSRSDNKGPEPEGVEIGEIGGRTYAFVGLERTSGILVYDVTDPRHPTYQTLALNRDFSAPADSPQGGDLGPEGLHFVSAAQSPTHRPLLVVGNEVSGTTTIWSVDVARATGPARTR